VKKPPTARDAAFEALARWRAAGHRRAEVILDQVLGRAGLEPRDRRLASELTYGVIRNLINLDHVLSQFIKPSKKPASPEIIDILRLAVYQVLYLDRVPAHAAVNEAVGLAKTTAGRGAGGFVNAVMRSLIRGKGAISYPDPEKSLAGYLAVKYSYPGWLAKRWVGRYGAAEAKELMEAGNSVPPLTLRANTLKTNRDSLIEKIKAGGIECEAARYAPDGITINSHTPVPEIPGYREGLFAVQDEAAQLVSLLLSKKPFPLQYPPIPEGEDTGWGDIRILDVAAAPGGKSAHIAAISGGLSPIASLDIGLDKLWRLKENTNRLGIRSVMPVRADISKALPVKRVFGAALLDAPCSALGVIRRRPEIKYARSEDDIARISRLQALMLKNVSETIKPGGVIVYSVCSTEPEEGEEVVDAFLASNRDFIKDDPVSYLPPIARSLVDETGYMRTYPHRHGLDGFFAARMVRI